MPEPGVDLLMDLGALGAECSKADWDGYNALPVTNATCRQAERFLKALPTACPLPTLGAIPCGSITFEWHREPRWTLTVSVTQRGELYYAALLGQERACGKFQQWGQMPPLLLDLIHGVMRT